MPHGFRDGNVALLVMAIFGEFVQGPLPASAHAFAGSPDCGKSLGGSGHASLDSVMM